MPGRSRAQCRVLSVYFAVRDLVGTNVPVIPTEARVRTLCRLLAFQEHGVRRVSI